MFGHRDQAELNSILYGYICWFISKNINCLAPIGVEWQFVHKINIKREHKLLGLILKEMHASHAISKVLERERHKKYGSMLRYPHTIVVIENMATSWSKVTKLPAQKQQKALQIFVIYGIHNRVHR